MIRRLPLDLILIIVFFAFLTPVCVISRWHRDPLDRGFLPGSDSYWRPLTR
jgi:hypothetical protein